MTTAMKFRAGGRLRLKADSQAQSTGLPKSFEILAYTGGKLAVDGFDEEVVVDLAGLEAQSPTPILIKHETADRMVLGQTDTITNNGTDLILAGKVTADPEQSDSVKRVLTMARNGHQWQASVGVSIEESYSVPAGATVEVNGQSLTGPLLLATRSVLRETSVLAMGADKNTRVLLAQLKGQSIMTFEEWVQQVMGLDPASLNDACREAMLQQYQATQQSETTVEAECTDDPEQMAAEGDTDTATSGEDKPDEATAKATAGKKIIKAAKPVQSGAKPPVFNANASASIQATRKQFGAEMRRIEQIQAKCGKNKKICATAIEQGWSVEKAELELLRDERRQNPPFGNRSESGATGMLQALQGAMILRAGGRLDHPGYTGTLGLALGLPAWLRAGINTETRQKVMEQSWKFRDMSMVDLCRASCQIDGREGDGSHRGFIRAAVSGSALADIFTTNINALFIQKFQEIGDSTEGWTKESEAQNFQPMERIRLTKGAGLTPHARGGEADHITRGDAKETYKIARYSAQFRVDEMDMIDDYFKALSDIPDEMAKACARLRPDLVYSIILANGQLDATATALFSGSQPGGQSNLKSSSGGLDSTNLQLGMASMFNLTENGVNLGLFPTHILVPMVKAGLAFNLLEGQNIALAGTAGSVTERGDINPLAALQSKFGKIQVVSDPRLTNGVIDPVTGTTYSGSSSTWRLVSNQAPTIEVSYLKGSGRAPQIRQYVLDKGSWGIGWDAALDIGAKALAWQGLYESRE